MSENNNEQFKMPPKRPRGPMGHGPGMVTEKAKDFKGSAKKLIKYLGRYWAAIIAVMIFAAVSTVFSVAGPKIMGKATTALAEGLMNKIAGTGGIDFDYIAKVLLFTLALYVVSAIFMFAQGLIMTGITQKTCYRMRKDITSKINRMPMKYFESRTYGEVLSRITNDVDTLGQSLNQSITQIITSVATLVGTLVMMLSISPLMTLISLVILPVSMILISFVIKHSQKYFRQQQEYLGHINGQVEEVYGGHLVIKAYNKEAETVKTFKEANNVLYKSAWKSQFLSGLMMPIMQFVGNLGYAGVAISGGILAIKNVITIGDIQAFIQYVKNFTQPIQQIAQVANQLQSMAAASERVFEFLDEEEEDITVENPVKPDHIEGSVEFSHVHFGYNPDQIIINDFSANVKPGQQVAIVGPTGAGKTTMVKLLMRFYDVSSGAILVDGHDIRDYNRADLRDAFGMVLQDTWLKAGTIRENIAYGAPDATEEQIVAAAKAAHAHGFIQRLPQGYATLITEAGGNRMGLIKSGMGIGGLLLEGLGDTLRVSLTDEPENEVYAGYDILRAVGYAVAGPEIISCPTCGRTQYPMIEIANEVEKRLRDEGFKKPLKIAIMGCVVNGPGEASDADIGIAGGKDEALLFIRGEKIRMLKGDIVGQLLDEIHKM